MKETLAWTRLLSKQRLGKTGQDQNPTSRTAFQKDFDRIIFSTAFRRLQDKTQVFPLTRNDFIRTRLTHSLEVASLGRSLGILAGETLIERHALQSVTAADFGTIVATACLAHDIGNPPFGHLGEQAIRYWAAQQTQSHNPAFQQLSTIEQADFQQFEGNAQGFRILSRLQQAPQPGGMQLTCATLGAFSKYPQATSHAPSSAPYPKQGFFMADQTAFETVTDTLGLMPLPTSQPAWCRHPLAYLMEAADDICYRIIDIEDGHRAGYFKRAEAQEWLLALLPDTLHPRYQNSSLENIRAKAIDYCLEQAITCFLDQEPALLRGQSIPRLAAQIPNAQELQYLQEIATQKIYIAREVVEVGAAGFKVIGGLLTAFYQALETLASGQTCAYSQTLLHLLPQMPDQQTTPYQRLLTITDFVSGMTDSYAVSLYKRITGISLP